MNGEGVRWEGGKVNEGMGMRKKDKGRLGRRGVQVGKGI